MVSDLLYKIGEATILEVEGIENITYPHGEEFPSRMVIETLDKQKFALTLTKVN